MPCVNSSVVGGSGVLPEGLSEVHNAFEMIPGHGPPDWIV